MSRSDNADIIELERRAFYATNNAMHAWAAYRLARVVGAPVPGWVLTYLDIAAQRLFGTAKEDNGESGAKLLADAFFFSTKGAGTPQSRYFNADWLSHGMSVHLLRLDGTKEDFAVEAVAEQYGVHPSTIRRGWKTYESVFPLDDFSALELAGFRKSGT